MSEEELSVREVQERWPGYHHRLGWLCPNSSLEDSVNASFISL